MTITYMAGFETALIVNKSCVALTFIKHFTVSQIVILLDFKLMGFEK